MVADDNEMSDAASTLDAATLPLCGGEQLEAFADALDLDDDDCHVGGSQTAAETFEALFDDWQPTSGDLVGTATPGGDDEEGEAEGVEAAGDDDDFEGEGEESEDGGEISKSESVQGDDGEPLSAQDCQSL
eukprot:2244544-Pyramimonas_sp.AAC.1